MRGPTVVVVGAGVAGLTCARELTRRGIETVVLERAGAVGGRCVTRLVRNQPVDFGAPFLHAASAEFGEALNELEPSGKVAGWPVRVREPRLSCQPHAHRPGVRCMARRAGVIEFPRHLAVEVDVRLGRDVVALEECGSLIAARTVDGGRFEASFLVLACTLGGSLDLAEPAVRDWPRVAARLARLRAITPVVTLTVIAGYAPGRIQAPFDIWYPMQTTMLQIISNDSSKREHPAEQILVLHGRPRYSAARRNDPPREWRDELVWELGELLGPEAARPDWTQTHVWNEARLRAGDALEIPWVFESPRGGRVALAGEAFAEVTGLEGAYMSGISLGEQIGTLPDVREGRV